MSGGGVALLARPALNIGKCTELCSVVVFSSTGMVCVVIIVAYGCQSGFNRVRIAQRQPTQPEPTQKNFARAQGAPLISKPMGKRVWLRPCAHRLVGQSPAVQGLAGGHVQVPDELKVISLRGTGDLLLFC